MTLVLTWSTEPDHRARNGLRHVLRTDAFPAHHFSPLCQDDRVGVCSHWGPRVYRASFYIGYDEIWTTGATAPLAIRRLEAELCKRSIGIFGFDSIMFETAT